METKQERHKRLAMSAAKRMARNCVNRRTLTTWSSHMKAFIKGAK
jgi:hypothetical protein